MKEVYEYCGECNSTSELQLNIDAEAKYSKDVTLDAPTRNVIERF